MMAAPYGPPIPTYGPPIPVYGPPIPKQSGITVGKVALPAIKRIVGWGVAFLLVLGLSGTSLYPIVIGVEGASILALLLTGGSTQALAGLSNYFQSIAKG